MGILRRSTRGKGQLPILLQQALELVASNDMD
jgi:hypothetical protein